MPGAAAVGGGQRADPGVELVFGQLAGKAFAAELPKVGTHLGWACGNLLIGSTLPGLPGTPRTAVIHSFWPSVNPLQVQMLWCKCLTGKGKRALIAGSPNGGLVARSQREHTEHADLVGAGWSCPRWHRLTE